MWSRWVPSTRRTLIGQLSEPTYFTKRGLHLNMLLRPRLPSLRSGVTMVLSCG